MAFNKNIPLAADILSVSQGDLKNNFTALNDFFDIDHVTFDAVSDNGKHKKTTFVEQSGDQTTAADEVSLYSKENPSVGGQTDLYLRKESNGSIINLTDLTTVGDEGSFSLPNGLIVKWGTEITLAGSGVTYTHTFPTAFPTSQLSLFLTSASTRSASAQHYVVKSGLSVGGFTTVSNGADAGVRKMNYLSIGI